MLEEEDCYQEICGPKQRIHFVLSVGTYLLIAYWYMLKIKKTVVIINFALHPVHLEGL